MYNIAERGRTGVCLYCGVKPGNEHSMKQSGECDGIRSGKINGTRAMQIRLRNAGKKQRVQEAA